MNLPYSATASRPVLTAWLEEVSAHEPSRLIMQALIEDGWIVTDHREGQLTAAAPSNQALRQTPTSESWPWEHFHQLTFVRLTVFMGRLGSQFISEGSVPWAAPVPFRSISYMALSDLLPSLRIEALP